MKRRAAAAWLASMCLGACGGGGGGGAATTSSTSGAEGPASTATPAAATGPAIPPPTTPNIALWGDSLVPPVYRALQPLSSDRVVFDGGVAGETSAQIAARQAADTRHRDWINVFWYGHNDIRVDHTTASARIKADLAASVARLTPGNNRFLILSVINNADTPRGSDRYNTIVQLNADLAAAYPQNFFDIRAFMVAQANPVIGQQAAELAADLPSSVLRFDEIHFTGFGADIVARRLKQVLESRGW